MNQNCLRQTLSALLILAATIACVSGGQAAEPASGIDSNAIATAVEGTARAAIQQTAAAQSPATIMTGTALEQLADGTTKYSDYDAGFEIIFPVGWLAVRPNGEEFNASLAKDGAVNSILHDQMTSDLAGYEADSDRLYSYILRPDIKKNVMFGFSKLAWDSNDTASLDSDGMGKAVRGLEGPGGIPGFRADTAQIHEEGTVRMVEIGGRFTLSDGQGGTIPFYATLIFFKPSPNSTVRVTFSFADDYHTQISADVQSIMNSIKIINSQQ